jgi:hypothetical protein
LCRAYVGEQGDDFLGAVALLPVADDPLGMATLDEAVVLGRQKTEDDWKKNRNIFLMIVMSSIRVVGMYVSQNPYYCTSL